MEFIITENGFSVGKEDGSDLCRQFVDNTYDAFYRMSFSELSGKPHPSVTFIHLLGKEFARNLMSVPNIESTRENTSSELKSKAKILASVPFVVGSEYVNPRWIDAMWNRYLDVFKNDISKHEGSVESYFSKLNTDLLIPNRLFFHLVENRTDERYPFAFMVTYSNNSSDNIPNHIPLKNALEEYRSDRTKIKALLSPLSALHEESPMIAKFMDSGELFNPIGLTRDEAFEMLRETELYESNGVLCRIPNWWRHNRKGELCLFIAGHGQLDAGSLMSCRPEISLGGTKISTEEARMYLDEKEGLRMVGGNWAEIDHDRLRQLLDRYEILKGKLGKDISIFQAMRILAGFDPDTEGFELGVSNGDWLASVTDRIKGRKASEVQPSDAFKGELRDYQKTGVSWMMQLSSMGLGACLADDMGLGKTIQVIAYIDATLPKNESTLIIVPASLVGNWEKEFETFLPSAEPNVAHGSKKYRPESKIVITTYATLIKNPELSERKWDNIIVDEAQNIKNPMRRQTITVKKLKGRFRLALTGTPVENSLGDLWSIFDFINPGLLGTPDEFSDFTRRMSDTGQYSRLRDMISPFILRRMKNNPDIQIDLPDKIEKNEYIDLTNKQIVLYRSLMDELNTGMKQGDPNKRLALILSMITKFKQLCNHPDNYLHNNEYKTEDSGKTMMLATLCEDIRDRNESVLVFTQYKEMIEPLDRMLEGIFGKKGTVIHGGIPPRQRTKLVDEFNDEKNRIPYMILSLKTGGFGLNLVSANHVIHYDRWWNPSVENQATDRAYRIGQKRNVMVHKFICRGTIEEKIDRLINSKLELAGNVIPSEEKWMTEMTDSEILELFRLV